MPRYRISFAREWTLGRWGFLDRFFHDLGGRESEPSKLANAWIVDYRGSARRLGRELAAALNIQASDVQQFGPIFDIEEVPGSVPRPQPREEAPVAEGAAAAEPSAPAEPAAAEKPATEPPPAGPTWIHAADVEDIVAEPLGGPDAGRPPSGEGMPESGEETGNAGFEPEEPTKAARERRDDLFRIRKASGPLGRHRAEAISGAARRRPPVPRFP